MAARARKNPAVAMVDSSTGHVFGVRKLLVGGVSGTDYSFSADGSNLTLLGSGGSGTVTLGDGILAGSLDGTIPLRPLLTLSYSGGTGIPWKDGVIYTEASGAVPATSATALLAGTIASKTSKITDMGEGRASIQPGSVHWRYKANYISQTAARNSAGRGFVWNAFPSPLVYPGGTGGSGTDILAHLSANGGTEQVRVDPLIEQQCATAAVTYTSFFPIKAGPFAVGRIASYFAQWNPNFGGFWNFPQARVDCAYQLVEIDMAAGDTLASRYGHSSLSVRMGMKCADPGNTGACTNPAGMPADFPVSRTGQCFDTLLDHFDFNHPLTGCGNMTPPAGRTVTVGWGWVPTGSGAFTEINAYHATALASVDPRQAVGWYQDFDISALVSQVAPAGTIKLYVAVYVTSDAGHPLDYPSGVPAFPFPGGGPVGGSFDAFNEYFLSSAGDDAALGFFEFTAS